MATPTEHITAIETALSAATAGLVEVLVDGVKTRFDRAAAIKELDYWRKREKAAAGSASGSLASRFTTLDVSGAGGGT